jgi:predicted dehydrogenase
MNKKYGIVLIGCGHIGAAHLEELYCIDNFTINGVVDLNAERAQSFAKKYNASSWSTDYHDFLKKDDTDIYIIATYTQSHLTILKDCIAAGKHVICEKPIASNIENGIEFYNIVKKSKSKVLVGHILRHNATYQKAAELIHSGVIGDVKLMRMVQNHHTMDWPRYKKLLESCPPIIDCGVHYFDVMQWFTGAKIISVGGINSIIGNDVPEHSYNYGIVTAMLSDGSVAFYESGWGSTIASQNTKEIIGDKGRLKIILQNDRVANREEGDVIEIYNILQNEYSSINLRSKYKDTYSQIKCLIRMIEENFEGVPTIDDVMSSFKVSIAADMAIRNNCVYNLDETTQDIIYKIQSSTVLQLENLMIKQSESHLL